MDTLSAYPLPDTIAPHDLQAFYGLAVMAASGTPLDDMLVKLRDHLQARLVVVGRPQDTPPTADRLVMVPLRHRGRYLGDLYLAPVPDVDSVMLAARLSLFSPVVALALAASVSQDESAAGKPDWQRAMIEERDRLEAVLESTNDAILMVNSEGIVVMATAQLETFTGIPRYDVLGYPVDRLAQAIEDQAGLPDTMANMLHALTHNPNESLGGEFEVREPQRRVLVWYSLPVFAQSGTRLGRIFAFRDATHERELDRMKTEFITLVSHELRTPLTSVKGFSDLILENDIDALDPDTREYLHIIALNADRLIMLINDILDVTRIETERVELKPDLCPMQDVIGQVAASMQPQLDEHRHHLTLDMEPSLPPVWADQARMAQILTNLVSNAIKYTLEPGEITVRARYLQDPEALPLAASRDQILPCVIVSVQDTGLGIAPEDQINLFKRFYRANTEATRLIGGTGLGLTIVKSFVEMHGGQIWFESAPGQGSIFHFTVPVVERQALAGYSES